MSTDANDHEAQDVVAGAFGEESALLWACVHEAGHVVIGLREGYDITSVTVWGPGVGQTAGVSDANVRVAVAGYAAVEAVLGIEALAANVAADIHGDAESDLMIAFTAAVAAGHCDEDAVWEHLEGAAAEVAGWVQEDIGVVAEIAAELASLTGLRILLGPAIASAVTRAGSGESGALEEVRTWWADLT
jgi:hypothetical protein